MLFRSLLFDVSPTTQGAYPTTEVGLRSMELALENEGVLAAEQEAVRAYMDENDESEEDKDEEEEEEEEEEDEKRSEEEAAEVAEEAPVAEEEDCGCDDNAVEAAPVKKKSTAISAVPRSAETTLETADAPVAEESEKIMERGAESDISMKEEKNAPAVVQGLGDNVQNVRAQFNLGKAIREAANGGLTGLEAEMSQEGTNEFRQHGVMPGTGINIPTMLMRADELPMGAAVGNDGASPSANDTSVQVNQGIATQIQGPVQNFRPVTFADKMGMRKITGVTGDISIPVLSDNVDVEDMTEGQSIESSNVSFTTVSLSPDRISAHTQATQQLLTQNSFDLQSFLAADIRRGLEQHYNLKIKGIIENITEENGGSETSGSGANGVLDASDIAFFLEELLREGNVDPAGAYILTEPTLYREMRRATLDAGSGLFAATSASRVGDYNAIVSTMFTDGNAYMVKPEDVVCAEWGGINIQVDPYTLAHKDVVRIIANQYVDCKILRAAGVVGVDLDGTD